ncbi:TOBE domain-containing protein [Nocardioides marinquilinus]|uniref:TOBE domain-containing protein n=1 Tax=Nocardioides marinquilinus TaxID=1210400 RepID=A0ABP9Q210_9ACTN
MRLSTRNQLRGTVTSITEGSVNATVTVDVGGQTVTSSITLAGLAEIEVKEGDEVVVLVKASDVMLAVED